MEPQINEGDLITVTQRCTRILKPKFFERLLAGKIRLGPRHEQRSRR
jgi:hypothetical protein